KAIDSSADHLYKYQSSYRASYTMLVDILPLKNNLNDVEVGTLSGHSRMLSINKIKAEDKMSITFK
ncbi:6380_t:CDS:1, partial [Gigaspora rosea]